MYGTDASECTYFHFYMKGIRRYQRGREKSVSRKTDNETTYFFRFQLSFLQKISLCHFPQIQNHDERLNG